MRTCKRAGRPPPHVPHDAHASPRESCLQKPHCRKRCRGRARGRREREGRTQQNLALVTPPSRYRQHLEFSEQYWPIILTLWLLFCSQGVCCSSLLSLGLPMHNLTIFFHLTRYRRRWLDELAGGRRPNGHGPGETQFKLVCENRLLELLI